MLFGDLVTVDQIVLANLAGLEQLLVTYPTLMAGGPTGSTRDGYGHINIQFDYSVPPCTEGYLPPSRVARPAATERTRRTSRPSASPGAVRHARTEVAPARRGNASPPRVYSGAYDPVTGLVPGVGTTRAAR